MMLSALLPSTALGVVLTLVVIPVAVAVLTTAGTLLVTKAGDAAARRRDRYAQAVTTLVSWVEFPYRVRRRTDDEPATLTALADRGHDLQEQLACHQAWIACDTPALARAYAIARDLVGHEVGAALKEAWGLPPVIAPREMTLEGWGPAAACRQPVIDLEQEIQSHFGLRRLAFWGRVPRSTGLGGPARLATPPLSERAPQSAA